MIKQLMLVFLFMGLDVQAATLLEGYAYANKPIPKANVVIHDAAGHKQQVLTNAQGYYRVDVTNFIPPITLSIDDHLATSVTSQTKRACADICVSSFANTLDKNQINTVNLNPFTDYLMSQIALQFGFIGPAQLIDKGLDKPVDVSILTKAYSQFHTLFDRSLTQVGIVADAFDPVQSTQLKMNKLFDLMLSHRAYDSTSGQTSHTVLLDLRFKPISEQSPFDYEQALNQKNEILSAKKRIFILSDSTASNYDAKVYPRMGWGQVFDQFIKPQTNVILINGAQSGRSSRSFYEEGWFDLMIPFMQKGDYLMIAFGHNDEKCDSSKAKRGYADVTYLCTYPNDVNNHKQYPAGKPHLSFQTSLERYIHFAKARQMVPILMTPVTRFRDVNNKVAYQDNSTNPVVQTHYITEKNGVAYAGNYSNTVKFTADINHIPLIDLEGLSIDFANQHKQDWRSYWLAVDPNDPRYPYYKNQSSGVLEHPDNTHFQEKGAVKIAKLIADAIKQDPRLQEIPITTDNYRNNK